MSLAPILFVISDGEHTTNTNRQAVIDAATQFKAGGGVVMSLGLRASGNGFDMLERISTPGFFVNALPENPQLALDQIAYLKSLLCLGQCIPLGDVYVHDPAFDYSSYAGWEVLSGQTHLLGPGLLDLLPGNGLYVDMVGGSPALMRTIDSFELNAGRTYRFAVTAAGNQRVDVPGQRLKVYVRETGISDSDPNLFEQIIAPQWDQGFQKFTFTFNAIADVSVRLYIEQLYDGTAPTANGNLVDRVEFQDATTLTTLFDDNFDDENLVYVMPRCGPSAELEAIDDPEAPTSQKYFDSGAALGTDETYQYGVSYVTQQGETVATRLLIAGANSQAIYEDTVLKITMPVPDDARVVRKRLWRSIGVTLGAFDPAADLYLLAELDAAQSIYIDSERNAEFTARYDNSLTAPAVNTTAVPAGGLGYGYDAECCYAEETINTSSGSGEDLVPSMTSNTDPSGTVSDESNGGSAPADAWSAFDYDLDVNNLSTWIGVGSPAGTFTDTKPWIQYQFPTAKSLSGYRMASHFFDSPANQSAPQAWTLKGSNDGSTWVVVDTRSGIGGWVDGELQSFTIPVTAPYTHWRLEISEVIDGTATNVSISTLQFVSGGAVSTSYTDNCQNCEPLIEAQTPDENALPDIESGYTPPTIFTSTKTVCVECPSGQTALESLVPAMTSASTPSGTVISSGGQSAGHETWKAFDNDDMTYADQVGTVSGYTGYHFPAAKTVTSYAVTARADYTLSAPRAWTFEGSNDGTNWTVLDTQANIGWFAGQRRSFTFTNATAYAYYRLNVTNNVSGNPSSNLSLAGIEMFGTSTTAVCATSTKTSSVSQSQADQLAEDAARAEAQSNSNCAPIYTATVSHTARCEEIGTYGLEVTETVTKQSLKGQNDAEKQAWEEAKAVAEGKLDCTLSNNEQQITLNDNLSNGVLAKAFPYPSVQHIAGGPASITKVVVNIEGLTHNSPADIHICLRSPAGTIVELMRNCGGVPPVAGCVDVDLVFDDTGAALPSGAPIPAGTYAPTLVAPFLPYPSPLVPAGPYGALLSAFNGEDANGSWSLWCGDDLVFWAGSIRKWSLTIT